MANSVEWIVLGSSSGNPSKDRACSGHLLSIDGKLILFDCGSGVTANFLRFGYDPLKIEAIFISHAHSDHLSDLAIFIQLLYLLKREKGLKLFMPEEIIPIYRQFLDAVYLFPSKFPFNLEILPMATEHFFDFGLDVLPHPNNHLRVDINQNAISVGNLPNRMESYSFEIKIKDKGRIFYSSDIADPGDVTKFIDQIDLLVIEATHVDIAVLPDILEQNRVRRALLTHYCDTAQDVVADFVEKWDGKTELQMAEDGTIIIL
jgi:ribonuclease BN (tRNA processing enzyme)